MSYLSYRNIPLRVLATLDLHGAVVVRVVVDGSDRDGLAHDALAHHLDDVALHVHDQLALLELDLWQLLGLGQRLLEDRLHLGRRGLALLDGRVESGLCERELALLVLRTCRLRSNTATAHKRTTGQWQYPANEASGNKEGFGTVCGTKSKSRCTHHAEAQQQAPAEAPHASTCCNATRRAAAPQPAASRR